MIIFLTEDSGCRQLALHPPHTSEWNYLKIQNTGNVTIELVVGFFFFFSFVCVKKKKKKYSWVHTWRVGSSCEHFTVTKTWTKRQDCPAKALEYCVCGKAERAVTVLKTVLRMLKVILSTLINTLQGILRLFQLVCADRTGSNRQKSKKKKKQKQWEQGNEFPREALESPFLEILKN